MAVEKAGLPQAWCVVPVGGDERPACSSRVLDKDFKDVGEYMYYCSSHVRML